MSNEIQHRTEAIRDHGTRHEATCGDLLNSEPRKAATAAAAQAKANIIAGKCYAFLKTVATMFETIMRVAAAVLTGLFTLGVGVIGNVAGGKTRPET